MAARSVSSAEKRRSNTCYFCGRWPATLYKDITEKHSHRVCEFCVEEGRVVKGEDGIYITNPEPPADPEGSPDSGSRSSSPATDAPDSAA